MVDNACKDFAELSIGRHPDLLERPVSRAGRRVKYVDFADLRLQILRRNEPLETVWGYRCNVNMAAHALANRV
jgi:hypothetical protein